MYFPMIGKNLKPWNEPQVATYSPFAAEWGEMMKSPVGVNASLQGLAVAFDRMDVRSHQQTRNLSKLQDAVWEP